MDGRRNPPPPGGGLGERSAGLLRSENPCEVRKTLAEKPETWTDQWKRAGLEQGREATRHLLARQALRGRKIKRRLKMQAIEFETVAQNHQVLLPDQVPDGVRLRVLILMEEDGHDARSTPPMAERLRHKPSPRLAGSVVMHDDLLAPAVPEEDWSALR
jgi:hypothetical protein